MTNIYGLLGDVQGFVDKITSALTNDGIDSSNLHLDHLCYRVETQDQYQHFKDQFSQQGTLLSEAKISGRMICTYKLHEPLHINGREISVIELPSPKKKSKYKQDLEHAEFVIDDTFEEFMNKYPLADFNTHDLAKAHNPDIRIKYDGFSVKFHRSSLEDVVKWENRELDDIRF